MRRARLVLLGVFLLEVGPGWAQSDITSQEHVRIGTWNVSWFGHPDFPPVDDARQISNVAEVIRLSGAEIFALQEVSSPAALDLLLEHLGPPYGGIISARPGDQRLALVYDGRRVQVAAATDDVLADHAATYVNRVPLFVKVRISESPAELSFLLVNVHLKAFQDRVSRSLRYAAVQILKSYLDRSQEHVMLLGDFNDQLSDEAVTGFESTLRPIRDDSTGYRAATASLERAGAHTYCATFRCGEGTMIDHVFIGRSLSLLPLEVRVFDEVLEVVPDFVRSTSDHLPLLLSLSWPARSARLPPAHLAVEAYPNPFREAITLAIGSREPPHEIALFDVMGRTLLRTSPSEAADGYSARMVTAQLPPGAYIVRVRTSGAEATRLLVRMP